MEFRYMQLSVGVWASSKKIKCTTIRRTVGNYRRVTKVVPESSDITRLNSRSNRMKTQG